MMNPDGLPESWRACLGEETRKPYFQNLQQFLEQERSDHEIFPAAEDVFGALRLTPLESVRVLILGQDPYHDIDQAHGLSFSVQRGIAMPPSLRNILKELQNDLGIAPASHGCLESWARQGVLLLNTVLTVRAHQPNSHRRRGWEEFTTRIIGLVSELPHVGFVLWGKPAQEKASLIEDRHLIIKSPHPSPLSANRGFFGSRPFSRINGFLEGTGQSAIDWRL